MITTKMVNSEALIQYEPALKQIEKEHEYPLDGSGTTFRISHGDVYSTFFSQMGESYFVLAFDGNQLVGCMAIVSKIIHLNNTPRKALYFCDLKLKRSHQGLGISGKMFITSFFGLMKQGLIVEKPFFYFISMQGESGDFKDSSTSFIIKHLFKSFADLNVYFASPKKLTEVNPDAYMITPCISLSPLTNGADRIDRLSGVKELINTTTKKLINLSHIKNHLNLQKNPLPYLSELSPTIDLGSKACFAIDMKDQFTTDALLQAGVEINGFAKVYCLAWDISKVYDLRVCVSTNEI